MLSARPTTIQATFDVSLPHPRKLASAAAQVLREAILRELGLPEFTRPAPVLPRSAP